MDNQGGRLLTADTFAASGLPTESVFLSLYQIITTLYHRVKKLHNILFLGNTTKKEGIMVMNFYLSKGKFTVMCLILIALVLSFIYYWNYEINDVVSNEKNSLVVAFENSGAKFQELTAQSWGKIDNENHSLEDIYTLYGKIEKVLGANAKIKVEENSDKNYVGITATGKTQEGYELNLTLQSISDNFEKDETYLIVNLIEGMDYQEAGKIKKTAESYFQALSASGETSVLISGYYDKMLSEKEKTDKSKKIFAAAGGSIIEGVDTKSYMSKSGYCPNIKTYINTEGKKINLQVALFDNEVQKQTCLFLGSPLIFSEY